MCAEVEEYEGECGKVGEMYMWVCGVHVCMCGCTCMSTFVCGGYRKWVKGIV